MPICMGLLSRRDRRHPSTGRRPGASAPVSLPVSGCAIPQFSFSRGLCYGRHAGQNEFQFCTGSGGRQGRCLEVWSRSITSRRRAGRSPPSMVERMTLILDAVRPAAHRATDPRGGRPPYAAAALDGPPDPRPAGAAALAGARHASAMPWASAHSDSAAATAATATSVPRQRRCCTNCRCRPAWSCTSRCSTGAEIVYLDKVGGRFAASLPSRVGGRPPRYSTALGKAMLAWLDPERVDQPVEARPEPVHRPHHRDLPDAAPRAAPHPRARGLAFERGEIRSRHRLRRGRDPRPRRPARRRSPCVGDTRTGTRARRAAGAEGRPRVRWRCSSTWRPSARASRVARSRARRTPGPPTR